VTNRTTGAHSSMPVSVIVGAGNGTQTDPPEQTTDDPARGA
jgi:hypothetical protein